jgi:hypothetical protein
MIIAMNHDAVRWRRFIQTIAAFEMTPEQQRKNGEGVHGHVEDPPMQVTR